MQRLFEFIPSEIKPIGEFFSTSEQCVIIRQHVGNGYFVATHTTVRGQGVPMKVCRMYWLVKHPGKSKRLEGQPYTYTPVMRPDLITTV